MIEQPMHRLESIRGAALGVRSTYATTTVVIPRCRNCERIHDLHPGGAGCLVGCVTWPVLLIVCFLVMGSIADQLEVPDGFDNSYIQLGLFLIPTVGALCCGIWIYLWNIRAARRYRPEGKQVKPLSAVDKFPAIKRLLDDGWQKGKPWGGFPVD